MTQKSKRLHSVWIHQGTSVKNSCQVTIINIAREAGVSYTTTSLMLSNRGTVKPETRERVLTEMTRLGYVVDQRAQDLAGGRSQVIGLLLSTRKEVPYSSQ